MPTIGNLGTMFVRDENGKFVPVPCIQGKNGITPHIGDNGNWWIGDTDTGAMADNKKYPVSAAVYETIFTEKPSEYTLEILLKDGERIRAKLPNMGLTPDDVVEIGSGEPSEFDDINYKQFYLDKNTGLLYINTSKMYPNSYITIGGVVLSGENDPTGGEDAYINNLYINTTTGAIFLCVRMESFMPSEPPHPVWQQIVGTGGDVGTDITLGITGAVVGRTVKITEVDENGKPVKWESADIPARTDIDSTLSIEGAAADAAEVGKKFTELSSAISDKITAPSTVTVGQTIVVSEVDENGKPTKWEAIDMASGGTSDAVQYISQELTDEQQMQTRENLGLYRKMVELKDSASVTVVKNNGLDAEIIGIKIYPAIQGGAWEEGDTIRVEIGTYVFEGTVSIDAIGYQEYGVFVDLRIPINTLANYYLRYDPLETKWTMSGDYEFTLETTETMRIYKVQLHPVPEEYIPDTIARKEDIDSTLSIEGAAADAKAVGDKVAELSGANVKQDERLSALEQGGGTGGSTTVVKSLSGGYTYRYIGCPFPAQNAYQSWPIAGVQYDAARNRIMCLVTDADKHVSATQYKLTLYALDPETSAIEEVAVLKDNTVDPVVSVSDAFWSQRGFLIDKDTGIYYKYHFGDDKVSHAAKSSDGGVTWEDITITATNDSSILYAGGNGQIIKTSTGRIICGLFANGFAYTDDYFETLTYYTSGKYNVDGVASGHEYEIIEYEPQKLIAIMRKTWQSRVGETWSGAQRVEPAAIAYSEDNGTTWTKPVESKTITNMSATNCCSFLRPNGTYELFVGTRYAAVDGELTAMYRYTASADDIANDAFRLESRTFYGVGDAALDGIANLAGCADDRGVYHLFWNDQQAYGDICRWHYMKVDPAGDNSSPAMSIPNNKEVQAYTAAAVDKKLEENKDAVQAIINAGAQWTTVFETTLEEAVSDVRSARFDTFDETLLVAMEKASEVAMNAVMPVSTTQESYGNFGFYIHNAGGGYTHKTFMNANSYTNTTPTTTKSGYVYFLGERIGTSNRWLCSINRTSKGVDDFSNAGMNITSPILITPDQLWKLCWRFTTTTEFPAGSTFKVEVR